MIIGSLVGKGNTAEVYEWGDNQIIKLFYEGYPRYAVEAEYRNACAVADLKFDKPEVFHIQECDNRLGIIYEKISGNTLFEWIFETHDIDTCGKILAEEHRKLLENEVKGVNKHKDILRHNIELTSEINSECKGKILELLMELPEGDMLCHGDFHPGNIMMYQDKRIIIDYMNLCSGHPDSDVARTVYLVEMTTVPEGFDDKEEIIKMKRAIVDSYLNYLGVDRKDIEKWLIPIVAARFAEGVGNEEKQSLLDFLQQNI